MSIPYYEPLNRKRPIVERVEACRPRKSDQTLQIGSGGFFIWFVAADPMATHAEDGAIAAALTRDAIKCWAANPPCDHEIGSWKELIQINAKLNDLVKLTDHAEVNAAAHALADALGID